MTFTQADPKEWAQVRSTVRDSCFVKRFPFFVAFPTVQVHRPQPLLPRQFQCVLSTSSFRFRDLVPFRLRCGWTFTSAHTCVRLWIRGWRAGHWIIGCWGFRQKVLGGPGIGSLGCCLVSLQLLVKPIPCRANCTLIKLIILLWFNHLIRIIKKFNSSLLYLGAGSSTQLIALMFTMSNSLWRQLKCSRRENWSGFSNCVEAEQQPTRRALQMRQAAVLIRHNATSKTLLVPTPTTVARFLYSPTLKSRSSQPHGWSGSAALPAHSGDIYCNTSAYRYVSFVSELTKLDQFRLCTSFCSKAFNRAVN